MYRNGRNRLLRRRRRTAVLGFAAVFVVSASLPGMAFGQENPIDNLLKNLGIEDGGTQGTQDSGSGDAGQKAGTPPNYEPPLHGTNPHGQGSDVVLDITPGETNPYPGNPSEGDEEVIVGDSRGEQDANGQYHGTVTLLWLFGNPIVQIQTDPGESADGPFQPLQDALNEICDGSDQQLCLSLLEMHSSSTGNSSTNSFLGVGAHIGGEEGINAEVLSSNGNISDDGTCQTAHGDSSVVDASIGGEQGLTADALQGNSTSTACNDGSQSVQQDSTVINLGGSGLPIPAAGCDDGTPNTVFDALSPLVAAVCNADDTNGSQTSAPYGVREALTVFALIMEDTALLKATTAGPESHAVAPGGDGQPPTPTTPPAGGGGAGEKGAGGEGADGEGAGAGAGGGAAGEAAAGEGDLAFTGADLLVLGLVGGALILGGLALTTTAGRRHRQTV